VLRHHFCLGNVITTVDAVNGMGQLDRQSESVKQIAVADRLILTKTDLVTAEAADTLVDRIRRINPAASLWRSAEQDIDAEVLLAREAIAEGAERLLAAESASTGHGHAPHGRNRHGEDIRAFALRLDDAVDWTSFGIWLTMLLHRHGEAVLRVKGILNVAGSETPVAVHGVQQLVHAPSHMSAWPDADRRSRLVFIVRGLDPGAIERSLRTFSVRLTPARRPAPPAPVSPSPDPRSR
jgi:G3E family GTPase